MDFNVENYLSNLSYINKDFSSVWNEILETVPKLTNKWVPSESNESDPLLVLLKELAIVTDKLNYNIDKNILELFPATLTQTRNAYNVYENLGYTPDWFISATTDLTLRYNGLATLEGEDDTKSVIVPGKEVTIPAFTAFSNIDNNIVYSSTEPVIIETGVLNKYSVPVIEGKFNDLEVNGNKKILLNNLDNKNRIYFPQTNIAQNSIRVSNYEDFSDLYENNNDVENERNLNSDLGYSPKIDSGVWERVLNLNYYSAGSKIYKLGIDNINGTVYLEFPEDIGTLIEDGLYIKYSLSSGSQGNIGIGDISTFLNPIELTFLTSGDGNASNTYKITESNFGVTNSKSTQNGKDPLDIEEMRLQFNKIIGVFNTLITLRDYENYIFNYIGEDGKHIVSNIRVSDRNTDLWDTLKYKSLDLQTDEILNSVPLKNNNVPLLEPYDLRMYPLQAVNSIDTVEDFNRTFNKGNINNNTSLSNINDKIEEILEDSTKCINHVFKLPGSPILIPYTLEGQIYLKNKVSKNEANNIIKKVELKIYNTVNSRSLEWGKPINYSNLIDSILKADNRIQYIALNPIKYESPTINSSLGNGYDLEVRNILRGNKPWTNFNIFDYSFNQIDGDLTKFSKDSGNYITNISTEVELDPSAGADIYLVNENENFTILIPQYDTVRTYTNYLYFTAQGSSSKSIPANNPYQLSGGEKIFIFTERPDIEDSEWLDKAKYTLTQGTTIRSSVDISFNLNPTPNLISNGGTVVNMGSNISIDVIERAKGDLKPEANRGPQLYLATTSKGLVDAFRSPKEYTLLSNEYLFYTDSSTIELGIIGEGTTLIPDSSISNVYLIEGDSSQSLLNGELQSIEGWTNIDTSEITISYKLNELLTLGENYAIKGDSGSFLDKSYSSSFQEISAKNLQYGLTVTNIDGKVSLKDGESLQTVQPILSNDKYKILIALKLITGPNITQELKTRGNITISGIPGNNNTYGTTQIVTLSKQKYDLASGVNSNNYIASTYYVKNEDGDYYLDNRSIFTEDETYYTLGDLEEVKTYKSCNLQSEKYIPYLGGAPLKLIGDEKYTNFRSYTGDTSYVVDQNGYIDVLNYFKKNTDSTFLILTVPGKINSEKQSTEYAIIPYSLNYKDLKYMLLSSGSKIKFIKEGNSGIKISIDEKDVGESNGYSNFFIGGPKIIPEGAKYYNNFEHRYEYLKDPESTTTNLTFPIFDMNNYGDNNIDLLYYNEINRYGENTSYSPILDIETIIEDPMDPNSFFLVQHPCNSFVLPYLKGMEKLEISQNSILK